MKLMEAAPVHIPALLKETLEMLDVQPGGRYIDCTLGTGGHAIAILEKSSPGGQLLGIDADPKAVKVAEKRLERVRDVLSSVSSPVLACIARSQTPRAYVPPEIVDHLQQAVLRLF